MFCNENPGPGEYFKESGSKFGGAGKSYYFAGKPRAIVDPHTPGPAEQCFNESVHSSFGQAPQWVMTEKPRAPKIPKAPGPQSYAPEKYKPLGTKGNGNPRYSMRPRRALRKTYDDGEPGPCEYSVLDAYNYSKGQTPYKTWGQPAFSKEPDAVPGPAHYWAQTERASSLGGRACTFKWMNGKFHSKQEKDPRDFSQEKSPGTWRGKTSAPQYSIALKLASNASTFYTSGNAPILALGPKRRALFRQSRQRSRALATGKKPLPVISPRMY